jgi:uncharacterized protein YwgA
VTKEVLMKMVLKYDNDKTGPFSMFVVQIFRLFSLVNKAIIKRLILLSINSLTSNKVLYWVMSEVTIWMTNQQQAYKFIMYWYSKSKKWVTKEVLMKMVLKYDNDKTGPFSMFVVQIFRLFSISWPAINKKRH